MWQTDKKEHDMKTLRYAVIFTAFVTCFTAKGQDRIVERDGQVIILQEGTKTDRSIIGRYIYCNNVDTAYALIVGHFYTTEEVERAFGKPQKIKDNISYENGFAFDGNISYTYDDLYLSVDCQSGLCEFRIRRENTSFYEYGRIVKIGDNISVLADDPHFHPMVAEQSEIFIDEKTGKRSIDIAINSTGDDDWIYYTFGQDMSGGLNLTVSEISYMQLN